MRQAPGQPALYSFQARLWLIALGLASALLLAVLPVGRLGIAAFTGGALQAVLKPAAILALQHSLVTGIAAAGVALVLGGGAALIVTTVKLPGRRLFSALFVLSMLLAPQIVALAFLAASGPSSPLLQTFGLAPLPGTPNPVRGAGGIALVLGLHLAPLAFVTLRSGLRTIPRDLANAAALDGATPLAICQRILIPLTRADIVAAGLLCFVAALGNFGIPALLGLPVNYLTLPTLIYRQVSSAGPSIIGDVAALSLLPAALAIAGVLMARWLSGSGQTALEDGHSLEAFWLPGRWRWAFLGFLAALITAGLVVPILSLTTAAFVPAYGVPLTLHSLTFDNFLEVLTRQAVTGRAFRNSILFAGVAGVACALLALPLAYGLLRIVPRWRTAAEALFDLPYALPGVVLGVAAILLFLRPLPVLNVSLYGTSAIIILAYVSRFLALPLKSVLAAMSHADPQSEEAASLCGANVLQRLRFIVLPAVAPAAIAAGLLVFLLAFNELTVSTLLWTSGTETLGVVLLSLEEAGLAPQAAALALCTIAAAAAIAAALEGLARRWPQIVLPWD